MKRKRRGHKSISGKRRETFDWHLIEVYTKSALELLRDSAKNREARQFTMRKQWISNWMSINGDVAKPA